MLIKDPATFGRIARFVSINVTVLFVLCVVYLPVLSATAGELRSRQILTLGTPITSDISDNQTKTFDVFAEDREYVHISIDKGDLKLSLVLYDPTDHKVIETASHRYETLVMSFVSSVPGSYRLAIRALEDVVIARQIHIKIDSQRPATANDRKGTAAQQIVASASCLSSDWTSASLRKAIDAYLQARSVWESIGKWREAARAVLSASEIHYALGEYRQSLLWSRYAASDFAKAHDPQGVARAFSRAGQMYSLLGDNRKGLHFSRKALAYYSTLSLAQLSIALKQSYGEALTSAGEVSYSTGDLVHASGCFEKSMALFQEAGDRAGEARARLFLGYIAATSGNIAEAKKQFTRSLDLSRELGNRMSEALSLAAIGTAHSLDRDEEVAIKMHRTAMEIFQLIGDRQSEAITLNGIGQAYQNLNEHTAALVQYKHALKLFEEHGNFDFAAGELYQIAKLYGSVGNAGQAEEYYIRCLNLSRTTRKKRIFAYALNDLAALHMSQGHQQKALAEYRTALRFYESILDRRGQALTLNNIGNFYLATGKESQALAAYKLALPLSRQGGDRGVEISTLYNLARAERAAGTLEEAVASVKAAIDIIEELRSNVISPDFRLSYFSSQRKYYDLYIDLLMQLDQEQPATGLAATALLASEKVRARSLCDLLAEAGADIRQGVKPEILRRERELQNVFRALAPYQNESYAPDRAPRLELLRAEYEEIQSQIREHNPRYQAYTRPKALTTADIQTELRDGNTLLLEYALGNEHSYLWAVTANSIKGYILPGRSSLERAAREVYEILTSRQPSSGRLADDYQSRVDSGDQQYHQKALSLSRLLLEPIAHELGNRRLLIVADGMLQYVPFEALPMPEATNAQTASDASSLLISRHEVVNLPSISTLAAIRAGHRQSPSPTRTLAAFADPVLSASDQRVRLDNTMSRPTEADTDAAFPANDPKRPPANGLIRLAHASEEAEMIATAASGNAWVAKGFAANRENVLSARLAQYRIIHFATHGIINTEHPELSGIVLSMVRPNGTHADGYLQSHDIYSLKLSADLTVLSACDTALGKDVKGEGLIGLTRGFMYAGSRSVVASLWKVDDRATAALMDHFYRKMLHEGLPPAAALRSAKEIVRKDPRWGSPYFWAGFVIQGEYLVPIEVDHYPSFHRVGVVSSVLLLFVVAACILVKHYRGTSAAS